MELLRTAVVDISTLVATCRALKARHHNGELSPPVQRRAHLRRELRRGTVAYIDTLARSRHGTVDEALLCACRLAAEGAMPAALGCQPALESLMSRAPGAWAGIPAARQDLWRLAHMAIYLGLGIAALRADTPVAVQQADDAAKSAARLPRRLRRAFIAYARASHRVKAGRRGVLASAREAALTEIGARAVTEAGRLAEIEARGGAMHDFIRKGVYRPLHDLLLDWQRGDGAADAPARPSVSN